MCAARRPSQHKITRSIGTVACNIIPFLCGRWLDGLACTCVRIYTNGRYVFSVKFVTHTERGVSLFIPSRHIFTVTRAPRARNSEIAHEFSLSSPTSPRLVCQDQQCLAKQHAVAARVSVFMYGWLFRTHGIMQKNLNTLFKCINLNLNLNVY